jgi:nicotinamidase-related amidase
MQRTALLIVDMLTDFLAPKPGLEIPENIASLIENNQKFVASHETNAFQLSS